MEVENIDIEISNPPKDGVTKLVFGNLDDYLLATSWDSVRMSFKSRVCIFMM
jgi:hypothetical protein